MDKIWNFLIDLAATAGIRILLAVLTLVIGLKLVKWIGKLLVRGRGYQRLDAGVQSFLKSFITIALDILLFFTIAGILGIPTTSFVTLLASAGVAIGLALQGALSNLAGGLMILIFRPFRIGDFIETNGQSGIVNSITIFYTILITGDNKHITLPNGTLTNSAIVNYSAEETRRLDLSFSVSRKADIEQVKSILLETASKHPLTRTTPDEPFARLSAQTDKSLDFILRVWCNAADYWTLHFDLQEQLKVRFEEAGIETPIAQMGVRISNESQNESQKE